MSAPLAAQLTFHTILLPSQGGRFDEEGITGLLLAPGRGGDPGISGTRNLQDNLSDLKAQVGPVYLAVTVSMLYSNCSTARAIPPRRRRHCWSTRAPMAVLLIAYSSLLPQVAANTKGIALVKDLIGEYGLPVVQAYMKHIQVGQGGRPGGCGLSVEMHALTWSLGQST